MTEMGAGTLVTPDAEALRAAVETVVAKLHPDQIILFGSGVRGEMHEHSDLDLLAIKESDQPDGARHHRLTCGETSREIDVFVSSRNKAEAGREHAGDVRGAALETGRTVYTRKGFRPIRTGPTYVLDGTEMVRRTLYKPDRAHEFLARAERKWGIAAEPRRHPADRCENLQASMEQALKGLIVAQGRHVEHKHDLNALWDEAERGGERIAVTRNEPDLDQLSLYANIYQYEDPADGMPEKTWDATRTTGADLLAHARAKIPTLVSKTKARLQEPGAPGSGDGQGSVD